MTENVQPIKSDRKLRQLEHELLIHGNGRENYTIFMVSMKCLLRISDVLKLKYHQVFNAKGQIINNVYTHDKKTGKTNVLDLSVLHTELDAYHDWLVAHKIKSKWLFPSARNTNKPMTRTTYYVIIKRIGDYIGLHVGTHTGRKCGAYRLYKATGNLALVMHALHHSSEAVTLHYLGITNPVQHNALHNLWSEN